MMSLASEIVSDVKGAVSRSVTFVLSRSAASRIVSGKDSSC